MAIEVQISPHPTYLLATLTGEVTVAAAKDAITTIMNAARESDLSHIVIDWRPVTGMQAITAVDRFEGTSFLTDLVSRMRVRGLHGVRIAHVVQEIRHDAEGFSQTVATNRGVRMLAATSLDEALALLGDDPTPAA